MPLTGHEGDTLKLAAGQIPAVGNKPKDNTYKAGSWNVTPDTETAITGATTYIYTYAPKDAVVVTTPPQAQTLTYNGNAQPLVTAGEAIGGTMYYAVSEVTDPSNPPSAPDFDGEDSSALNRKWSKTVPARKDAGT